MECWQDLSHADKINKLMNNEVLGALADCQFLVGPEISTAKTITGHKLMFALQSPALEIMLTGNFVESAKCHKIRIEDVLPEDFENFRYMIYHNDYNELSKFSFEEIFGIYRVANKYLVLSLCEKCLNFLSNSIKRALSFDRLLVIYDFAIVELDDKTLQDTIQKEISERAEDKMPNVHINTLSTKAFYAYLHFVSKSNLKPISIFKAIQSYFDYNCLIDKKCKPMDKVLPTNYVEENKQNGLVTKEKKSVQSRNDPVISTEDFKKDFNVYSLKRNLLKLVNFDQMVIKEFIDGPGNSFLLSKEEKYDWLSTLCKRSALYRDRIN